MPKDIDFDSKILGQILLLQSALQAAPDETCLAEQVCYTLISIPGLESTALYLDESVVAADSSGSEMSAGWPLSWPEIDKLVSSDHKLDNSLELIPLQIGSVKYGYLALSMTNKTAVSIYLPFIIHRKHREFNRLIARE